MDFTETMTGTFRLKRDKRANKRKTVNEIIEVLQKIKEDLDSLEAEKKGHIARLEEEKKELEKRINEAAVEKERGKKIFTNISNLLGE